MFARRQRQRLQTQGPVEICGQRGSGVPQFTRSTVALWAEVGPAVFDNRIEDTAKWKFSCVAGVATDGL